MSKTRDGMSKTRFGNLSRPSSPAAVVGEVCDGVVEALEDAQSHADAGEWRMCSDSLAVAAHMVGRARLLADHEATAAVAGAVGL